jgi:LysM repeat protein
MLLKEWLAINSKDILELLEGNTGEFDVATGNFVDYTDAAGNTIFNDKFNPLWLQIETVVSQGDTLSKIAQKNGTTVEAIMKANPGITDANVISAGQTLNMPGGNYTCKKQETLLETLLV